MPLDKATSLGFLDYKITNLPAFYVAEIETLESNKTQCLSRKLRTQAVESFLNYKLLDRQGKSQYSWVVNYRAKEGQLDPRSTDHGPIDHLILLLESGDETIYDAWTALDSYLGLEDQGLWSYKPIPEVYRRDANGNRHPLSIGCRIRRRTVISTLPPAEAKDSDRLVSLYHQCLDTYICSKAVNTVVSPQRGVDKETTKGCAKPAHKDWFVNYPGSLGETPLKLIMDGLLYFAVRAEPKLIIHDRTFRLDFDLALGLSGQSQIIAFLCRYLGNDVLGPKCTDLLPTIKSILVGLDVMARYTRVSPVKRAKPAVPELQVQTPTKPKQPSTPKLPTPKPNTPGLRHRFSRMDLMEAEHKPEVYVPDTKLTNHGPYRILDVKMPGEVPRFVFDKAETGDGEGGTKKFSVADYFEKVNNTVLQYPNLPYAKVRHDTWIPMELLETHGQQLLRKTGQLTTLMQKHVKEFCDESENRPKGQLEGAAKKLNIGHGTLPEVLGPDSPNYLPPAKERLQWNQKKAQVTTEDFTSSIPETHHINIVYFPSPSEKSETAERFIEDISKRVTAQRAGLLLNKGPFKTTIWVGHKLMLHDHPSLKLHRPEHILMFIIDELGRTKATVDHIRAECYRTAHMKLGSLAICVSKQDLDRSISAYASYPNFSTHFPQGVVQKINYMLRRTNHRDSEDLQVLDSIPEGTQKLREDMAREVKAELLNFKQATEAEIQLYRDRIESANPLLRVDTTDEDLQVVTKAMIVGAHIAHPDSSAAANCPSVAAIVGSNRATTHYLGSAGVQNTMITRDQRTESVSEREPKIKHVVQSRIVDLKRMMTERLETRNQPGPIIFFRNSNVDLKEVADQEIKQIKLAWKECYQNRHDLKLVYIVVNRRSRAAGVGEKVDVGSFAIGKYQYTIHKDDLRLHPRILLELVKRLDKNNQLGGDVSIALPIHFAQKLTKRFFNYFQFYATDSAGTYPEILRETYDPIDLKMEANTTRFIQKHLVPGQERIHIKAEKSLGPVNIVPSPPSTRSTAVELPLSTNGTSLPEDEDAAHMLDDGDSEEELEGPENFDIKFHSLPWKDRLNKFMFYL